LSPGVHGISGAGKHSGDVFRLFFAEGRHVEQEVEVQQRVRAAGVNKVGRAVDRERALLRDGTGTHCAQAIGHQIFEKPCGPPKNDVFWGILSDSDRI
jgi:hypothetical protein